MKPIKLAFRSLARAPFVSTVAVLSLALGIGANTAIFSLFDRMLLQGLPVEAPEELVNLGNPGPKPGSQSCGSAGGCDVVFSYAMFRDLEREQQSLTGVAAHVTFGANLAHANQTLNGVGMLVSGSYFPVLGVRPALGRLLGPADDQVIGGHFVVVLSHYYWANRLGADPSVLNQTLIINGHPMTVVGVAARGFTGTTLGTRPDVFVPLTMRGEMVRGWDRFDDRQSYWAYLFGRLRPGVSIEQAGAELNTLYHGIINEVEAPLQEGMSEQTMERFRNKDITLEKGWRGQSNLHHEVATPLSLLLAVTGVVLFIACANIANLLLAQGANRSQEMAVRGSLGASRRQLLTQLLTDSCVLALVGGVISLVVALGTLRFIASMLPAEATSLITVGLRPSVLLFAAVVSMGTGVLFGLYPALHATRPDLMTVVRSGTGQSAGGRAAARFRSVLVTAQIALSMALLVCAGLFVKSLNNIGRIDLGLDQENVVTFGISPVLNGYEPERSQVLFQRLKEELAAITGVTAVSSARVPVLGGNSWGTDVSVEGFELGPDIDNNSRYNEVGPAFFGTLGIPLLSGREFTDADAAGGPRVAVVNEAFTRKFGLDGRDAVGKLMSRNGNTTDLDIEIVGLIGDAKYSDVKDATPPVFYTPARQNESIGATHFYVRTARDPATTISSIRDAVARLDPNLPVEDLKTLEQGIKENVVMDRFLSLLSAAFAVLATVLAAIGLYGVLAYSVAQRTREIGLRMALGANTRIVRAMVLWQVARMTMAGAVFGLVAAFGLSKAAGSLLFGLQGADPVVFVGVSVLLGMVSMAAGYLPARKATRVDPMLALRYE